jgi:hypothetical protein
LAKPPRKKSPRYLYLAAERAEAALGAYRAALDWTVSLPAGDAQRKLVTTIETIEHWLELLRAALDAPSTVFAPNLLAQMRADVAAGAGHECEEWNEAGVCALCDRALPRRQA